MTRSEETVPARSIHNAGICVAEILPCMHPMMRTQVGEDLCDIAKPKISVLTPSLNHGRFLRQTIESVASQTFRNFEHIVVDGGSTDETGSILKEYPHVRWVSEKDNDILDAYHKGLAMARGQYIIQCCVSDGFLDQNWFRKCAEILDKDEEVSLVWGFAQTMSEEGDLLNVSFQDFFADPPPQKQDFLAFWLSTGFPLPEGNYCVRRLIMMQWFPSAQSSDWFRVCPHLGFMFHFFTQGYCPYFVPVVANFGRMHHDQRSQRLRHIEKPGEVAYIKAVRDYGKSILSGKVVHSFRNGESRIIGQIRPSERIVLLKNICRHRVLRSRLLRVDPYTLGKKIKERIFY